jgi:hypothetical protein
MANVKFGEDTDVTGAPIMFSTKQENLPVDDRLAEWARLIFAKRGNIGESKIIFDSKLV